MYDLIDEGLVFKENNNRIIITPLDNGKCLYELITNDEVIYSKSDKNPSSLGGMRSDLMKQIKALSILNLEEKDKIYIETIFDKILNKLKADLEDVYNSILMKKEMEEVRLLQQEKMIEETRIKEAIAFYKEHDNFLIYLASLFDWVSAGERANIMLVFLSFCSQIIFNEPISVIGLGEGSSGKTFIIQTALSCLPQEHIVNEKKATLASMFRRSQEDPHYYDGKIVNLGDLGEVKDKDEQVDVLAILKELQTEGHLERPVVMSVGKDMRTENLVLDGYCCLTYTTVPNKEFDSQEMSRSLFFKPRTNNRKIFNDMKKSLEWVDGASYITFNKYDKILKENIPFIIKYLKKEFENINVINPYMNTLQEFIGDSEYYKRDLDKYNNILKIISVFNYNNKEVYVNQETNNRFILVSKNDMKLFYTLMEQYHMSIQYNISKQSSEIYQDLLENFDDYIFEVQKNYSAEQKLDIEEGLTVQDYKEQSHCEHSLRSLHRFFKELREMNLIKSVDIKNKSNMYALTELKHMKCGLNFDLTRNDIDIINYEFGSDIINVIESDMLNEMLSIFNQDTSIKKPLWRG